MPWESQAAVFALGWLGGTLSAVALRAVYWRVRTRKADARMRAMTDDEFERHEAEMEAILARLREVLNGEA